jgi:peptidoglycan/xylan/chitin deacetylase (PgdA/CDA1 family)
MAGLNQALAAMEAGKHPQALGALKSALTLDRNEPAGILALGTLYLHTGSPARAAAEFERARALAPGDALAAWGAALAGLVAGKRDPALFDALPAGDLLPAAAPLLAGYVRLLAGDAAPLRAALAGVTEAEPDPLRLQMAAFAALRGGDGARGEALLRALLARPAMDRLAEDRAFVLRFDPDAPAEGGSPPLSTALGFPAAASGRPLSGRVTLSPGAALPPGTAYVSYTVEGGGLSSTTNYAPFTLDWNTARLPNGLYTLRTTVYGGDARVLRDTVRTVRLANAGAPRPGRLTPEQADDTRARLTALLTPRPSRKAAHFALAERAAARGDGATALQHIEAVVAIDPLFRNARASLRRYNLQILGPREGIWRARTAEKLVALTFDDGPNPRPAFTPALLDALRASDAVATFFVVGARAEQSPELLRRMADEGHEVANHSYSHQNLTQLTATAVERELCRTSVVIRRATGKRPRFYRPPGGNGNSAVREAAEAMGMAGAFWTADAHKYETAASRAALIRYVLEQARPGAILLLHNAPPVTVAAVPDIVRGLRAKGFTLVTMTELVRRAGGRGAPVRAAAGTVTGGRRGGL